MKNRIATFIVLLGAAFLGATALAQTGARFNVPFAFTANRFPVPAGTYNVWLGVGAQHITLLNQDTGQTMFLAVRHETGQKIETIGLMTFNVQGKDYVLKEIRMPGSDQRGELMVPHVYELKTAKLQSPAPTTVQIASR